MEIHKLNHQNRVSFQIIKIQLRKIYELNIFLKPDSYNIYEYIQVFQIQIIAFVNSQHAHTIKAIL